MELYDIINQINAYIPKDKGMLVLHRSMKECKPVKIYKVFEYNLWIVKGKEKELYLTHTERMKVPLDEIEECWKKADINFISPLINFLMSDWFKENYNEFTSNSI